VYYLAIKPDNLDSFDAFMCQDLQSLHLLSSNDLSGNAVPLSDTAKHLGQAEN